MGNYCMSLSILSYPSPNFDPRPEGVIPQLLVLHYTGMRTMEEARTRMCDPVANVSAHYLVDEDGTIYQLVDEQYRAWHAGVSYWRGQDMLNATSIGIEVVNPGHEFGYRPFPMRQMQALVPLCQDIIARYSIRPYNVVAHSDIAPDRKMDPGELFDWAYLARYGIGLWPEEKSYTAKEHIAILCAPGDKGDVVLTMQQKLHEWGYKVPLTGHFDAATQAVVIAFRRRFVPEDLQPVWDTKAERRLKSLFESCN